MDTEETVTNGISFWVEPQCLDLGNLKPGHGADATLEVVGGPGQVTVHCDRLRATPASFGSETTEIRLTLLPGSAGELMWDDILVQGSAGEQKVLVTARWEGVETPALEPKQVSPQEPPTSKLPPKREEERRPKISPRGTEAEKRLFKGNKCRWCGKNMHYDTYSHSWSPCKTCHGVGIPAGIIMRLSREFYLGSKELRPALSEIWQTLIGREERR